MMALPLVHIKRSMALIILSASISITVAAKQDSVSKKKEFANSFAVQWTYSDFPKVLPAFSNFKIDPFTMTQYGIAYERKLYKNIRVTLEYAEWNMATWFFRGMPDGFFIIGPDLIYKKGYIDYRKKYKMADLLCTYRFQVSKKLKVDVSAGPSCYWGINEMIDSVDNNSFGMLILSNQKATYYGVVYALNYNYLIFNNRVSFGIDAKYRDYHGYRVKQVDYGLHAAFNF